MSNDILKGKLIRWNDKKGFGFIKLNLDERDIFIHISSLKNRPRKAIIGDRIFSQIHAENNGKQRVVNSKIEGLKPHKKNRDKTENRFTSSSQYSETKIYESQYSCSGKMYDSEMDSCEEARFYLNTKLDGNNDGVPCERQGYN